MKWIKIVGLWKFLKLIFIFRSDFRLIKVVVLITIMNLGTSVQSQNNTTYSFFVAGHAYGAHAGTNTGLHPPFLKKLTENLDSSITALFLTGDIVNQSNTASWNQVEKELTELNLNSFYVMGNHDNNSVGHAVFKEKHGGDFYSFTHKNELYIILNSTESDRSISTAQLNFLDEILSNTDSRWERVFIFFHEVIWNSNSKYKFVRSNSRSRYDQLVGISNFWDEVYPRLIALPEKKFYLFAGDVGGNIDAIAASYDKWENVTLLSSGMGEVKDENFLKINVLTDTVTFQLIPLNNEIEMKPLTWYNVPGKPDTIFGPTTVTQLQSTVNYIVSPVENATSYKWNLSNGIFGSSDSLEIIVHFDGTFQAGKIAVAAVNDGFGESDPVELEIKTDNSLAVNDKMYGDWFEVQQNQKKLRINFNSSGMQKVCIRIYNLSGRIVSSEEFLSDTGFNSKEIDKTSEFDGFVIVELALGNNRFSEKIICF